MNRRVREGDHGGVDLESTGGARFLLLTASLPQHGVIISSDSYGYTHGEYHFLFLFPLPI